MTVLSENVVKYEAKSEERMANSGFPRFPAKI
jgi:hypothetical protein